MPMRIRLAAFVPLTLGLVPMLPAQVVHEHGSALGRVAFPVSCNAEARSRFEHAMAALHSFWWDEAGRAFDHVAAADSACAMAYWGLALNAWEVISMPM